LEFYLGEAVSQGADTVLITGAVQSNFVRLTAAAACKLGLACHIQLEDRVPDVDEVYRTSGNVLLDRMLGAHLHYYEKGEDETGADRRIREIASELEDQGRRSYVIPLSPGHAPLGALGYVLAAQEILDQIEAAGLDIDEIVVASGSGHTHAGLLFGLKALGSNAPITGICVRRDAVAQRERIRDHCVEIAELLDIDSPVKDADINLIDDFLPPGYGRINTPTLEAIELAAQLEGLIVDPTYTAKSMAGFIHRARQAVGTGAARMLFIHTGGQPAIFGSEPKLTEYFKK
jgi:D-cysteine desulfhydrase/L-cysteate sulfo-lyase